MRLDFMLPTAGVLNASHMSILLSLTLASLENFLTTQQPYLP
jgi:hypothetical protein